MGKSIYTPQKTIKIQGFSSNEEPVILEYKKTDSSLKKEGESSYLNQDAFPVFLQLFFFPEDLGGQEIPESFAKNMLSVLKSAGIDTEKKTLTVVEATNEAGISIGKDKRFSKASELVLYKRNLLPASLKLSGKAYRFLEYSKSINPMTFPGKIEILEDGKIVETWTFYRKEFKPE
jgi:hypothetical protein